MKRKWLLTLLIPIPVLFILFIAARLTGVFQIYRTPTPSNEPTIKPGRIVFTSIFKQPASGDFIAYKSEYRDSLLPEDYGSTHLHRLLAKEGDIIQMKDGICFINEKNADADKNLKQNYIIGKEILEHLSEIDERESKGDLRAISESAFEVFLTTEEVTALTEKGIKIEKVIYKSDEMNMGTFAWMKKDSVWSVDNFGPLKIPKNCFFVLGDNRHNALDSRYVGFIKKENFRGTVLGIY